jgi:hypothetical protein
MYFGNSDGREYQTQVGEESLWFDLPPPAAYIAAQQLIDVTES